MTRRIVTTQLEAAAGEPMDGYFDRVIKYIPVDIVAAWVAASGLVAAANRANTTTMLWIVFAFLAVLTPIWVVRQTQMANKPPAYLQAGVSTAAFIVWVFALGGPFAKYSWWDVLYGSLALIGCTLIFGLIKPAD